MCGKFDVGGALAKKAADVGLRPRTVTAVQRWATSHTCYREDIGFKAGDKDTQWISALPAPDQTFLLLFQKIVFQSEHEMAIKQLKISGSAVAEMLDKSPVKEMLDEISQELIDLGLKTAAVTQSVAVDGVLDIPGSPDGAGGSALNTPSKNKRLVRELSEVDDTNQVLKPWIEFAKAKYHNSCKIIVDPNSSTGIEVS